MLSSKQEEKEEDIIIVVNAWLIMQTFISK